MSSVLSHGQLTVPPGLPAALESLARAVLKEQPDDLPKFAASHFHMLLSKREESGRDPFSDSIVITEQTVPSKFDKPLPESQRSPSPKEDMGSVKSKTPVDQPKEEPVDELPVKSAESLPDTSVATEGPDEVTNERSTPTDGPDSEAVDIDLNDPEVNEAATKIQAAFRGHQVRKEGQGVEDSAAESDQNAAPESEQTQVTEEIDIDLDDPKTAEAAVKIQSAFRGHQVRKDMKEESKPEIETESATETVTETAPEPESKPIDPETGEVIDIDLNDPAAEDAAVKIQAAFRGHQVRAEMSTRLKENAAEDSEGKRSTDPEKLKSPEPETAKSPEPEKAASPQSEKVPTPEPVKEVEQSEVEPSAPSEAAVEKPATEEMPPVEQTATVEESPAIDETPTIEETATVEETPPAENTPAKEETPVEETATPNEPSAEDVKEEERAASRADEIVDAVVERVTTPLPSGSRDATPVPQEEPAETEVEGQIEPEKVKSPEPEKVKTPEPEKMEGPVEEITKTPEPEKNDSSVAEKVKSPEPEKPEEAESEEAKSVEPEKIQSPEPEKVKSPEPEKPKSPEPEKASSPVPEKVKSPEPSTAVENSEERS